MDSAIEVRYAGVAVGRATQVRDWTAGGAFIGFAEPLPTGTRVELRGDAVNQPAQVEEVIESSDPAVVGMRVRFLVEGAPEPVPAAGADSAAVEPSESSAAGEPVESGPNTGAGGGKRRRRRR